MAIPRDPNPYQESLYEPLRRTGVSVRYAGELTPSRTLNLLLLPAELLGWRLRGFNIFHVHWTFAFRFTGGGRRRIARFSRWWFTVVLALSRRAGLRLVWTAHNVMPHSPVFDDDLAARRTLIRACDLVVAHTQQAVEELAVFGVPLPRVAVIPHGPAPEPGLTSLPPPLIDRPRRLLHFGRMAPYKGVEDLLAAFAQLKPGALTLTVAGECPDGGLAARLRAAARERPEVTLRLGHVPDTEVAGVFAAADAIVYPFRRVTTSGSVQLGLASGRPVLIPDLPAFAHLPADAALRYQPGPSGLVRALGELAKLPAAVLTAIGAAGRRTAGTVSWDAVATRTRDALEALL